MKTTNKVTACVVHIILTLCLVYALMCGVQLFFTEFRALDLWFDETFGWFGIAMIFGVCLIIGRALSIHFVMRILIPWLEIS